MTILDRTDRARLRAEKLNREAANCLSLAVTQSSAEFAADLIAEAAMLVRRARELSKGMPHLARFKELRIVP